jgi:hypothetical protein
MTCLVVLLNSVEKKNEAMIETPNKDIESESGIGNGSDVEKSKKNEEISELFKADEMKVVDGNEIEKTDTLGRKGKDVNVIDENLERKRRKNNFKFQLTNFVREYL